jgi:Putative addiction module component
MNDKVKILVEEARKLSEAERDRLLRTLESEFGAPEDEVEQAWAEEAGRRSAAYAKGEIEAHDADEVLAELKARLAKRRGNA